MTKSLDHKYFISLAFVVSTKSTCQRAKVGAVIVDESGIVVATGYNGSMPGYPHCVDVGCLIVGGRCRRTTHAEANAIIFSRGLGRALYTTHNPCADCVKLIEAHRGIDAVYYAEDYEDEVRDSLLSFNHHGPVRFIKFTETS